MQHIVQSSLKTKYITLEIYTYSTMHVDYGVVRKSDLCYIFKCRNYQRIVGIIFAQLATAQLSSSYRLLESRLCVCLLILHLHDLLRISCTLILMLQTRLYCTTNPQQPAIHNTSLFYGLLRHFMALQQIHSKSNK